MLLEKKLVIKLIGKSVLGSSDSLYSVCVEDMWIVLRAFIMNVMIVWKMLQLRHAGGAVLLAESERMISIDGQVVWKMYVGRGG